MSGGKKPQGKYPDDVKSAKPDKGVISKSTTESVSSFKTKGRLFSLEIVLDKLQLSYYTEFMNRCHRGPNIVAFRFLRQGPFTICENKAVTAEALEKRTGSSALFTLTVEDLRRLRKEFCLQFEVYRNTPDEDIVFGKACISLVNLFKCVCAMTDANEYRKALIEQEEATNPPPCPVRCKKEMIQETTHQSIVINAPEGSPCEEAAVLTVFMRMSCFGSMEEEEPKDPPCKDDKDDRLPKYVCCCSSPERKQSV